MTITCIGNVPPNEAQYVNRNRISAAPRAVSVSNAIVPALQIVQGRPLVAQAGAYIDGALIPESRLLRSNDGATRFATQAFDDLPEVTQILKQAVFGGYLFHHFGHFLLESMARLWWVAQNGYTGPVVFQLVGKKLPQFQLEMFRHLGIEAIVLRPGDCVQVDHLVVPEAAMIERVCGHPHWIAPFNKIRASFAADHRHSAGDKLYVSRGTGISKVHGEKIIQQAFEAEGYSVLDPATAPLSEQIGAFANARHIVGMLGSAMHNLVYARRATSVATICRTDRMHHNFAIVDQCVGTYESTYIYPDVRSPLPNTMGPKGTFFADPRSTIAALQEAGFLSQTHDVNEATMIATRDAYMAEYTTLFRRHFPTAEKSPQPPVCDISKDRRP